MEVTSARCLWRKLESLYQSKSLVNKLLLRKKWYKLHMEEGDSFSGHLTTFNTLVGQLVSIGEKISDEDRAITLLCSLPDSWDNLIVVIGGNGDRVLSYESVCAALLSEETRRTGTGKPSNGALAAKGRTVGRSAREDRVRNQTPGSVKLGVQCWRCQEYGHLKKDCRNGSRHGGSDAGSSSGIQKGEGTSDLYVATARGRQSGRDVWIIDTGASCHMTPHRHWFCDYEKVKGETVTMGDETAVQIAGCGSVRLWMADGTRQVLSDVLHVPSLGRNLLSVGAMAETGVTFSCDQQGCQLMREGLVIARGVRIGTLYRLLGVTEFRDKEHCMVASAKAKGVAAAVGALAATTSVGYGSDSDQDEQVGTSGDVGSVAESVAVTVPLLMGSRRERRATVLFSLGAGAAPAVSKGTRMESRSAKQVCSRTLMRFSGSMARRR